MQPDPIGSGSFATCRFRITDPDDGTVITTLDLAVAIGNVEWGSEVVCVPLSEVR